MTQGEQLQPPTDPNLGTIWEGIPEDVRAGIAAYVDARIESALADSEFDNDEGYDPDRGNWWPPLRQFTGLLRAELAGLRQDKERLEKENAVLGGRVVQLSQQIAACEGLT